MSEPQLSNIKSPARPIMGKQITAAKKVTPAGSKTTTPTPRTITPTKTKPATTENTSMAERKPKEPTAKSAPIDTQEAPVQQAPSKTIESEQPSTTSNVAKKSPVVQPQKKPGTPPPVVSKKVPVDKADSPEKSKIESKPSTAESQPAVKPFIAQQPISTSLTVHQNRTARLTSPPALISTTDPSPHLSSPSRYPHPTYEASALYRSIYESYSQPLSLGEAAVMAARTQQDAYVSPTRSTSGSRRHSPIRHPEGTYVARPIATPRYTEAQPVHLEPVPSEPKAVTKAAKYPSPSPAPLQGSSSYLRPVMTSSKASLSSVPMISASRQRKGAGDTMLELDSEIRQLFEGKIHKLENRIVELEVQLEQSEEKSKIYDDIYDDYVALREGRQHSDDTIDALQHELKELSECVRQRDLQHQQSSTTAREVEQLTQERDGAVGEAERLHSLVRQQQGEINKLRAAIVELASIKS